MHEKLLFEWHLNHSTAVVSRYVPIEMNDLIKCKLIGQHQATHLYSMNLFNIISLKPLTLIDNVVLNDYTIEINGNYNKYLYINLYHDSYYILESFINYK